VDQPTRQAILPQVVPKKEMINAVVLVNIVWQLSYLAGPAVAGMLIYLSGVGLTFYAAAGAFLATVALLLCVRVEPAPPAQKDRSLRQEMADGLNYIRGDGLVRALIGLSIFNGIFALSYQTLMPVFARDILDAGSRGYGFLQAAGGAGSVIGALLVAYLARYGKKGRQIILGAAASGLLLVAFAFSTSYPLSMAILFVIGLTTDLYLTTTGGVLQLHLPDRLRGRVFAIYGLTWSLMPLGGMIAGAIAEYAGAPAAVALAGLLVTAAALYAGATKPELKQIK
jgi:MFS family permease